MLEVTDADAATTGAGSVATDTSLDPPNDGPDAVDCSDAAPAPPPAPSSLDDEENDGLCVVCFENPMGTRLEPCGHSYFCQECAGEGGVQF